ncbi:MAG: hypothetical protein GPJ54_13985, partial [Candidatus Heimdallarchaeota archaeon]|nr:hypothetical protein [Candidatus Heimdallarchaeota archaeon]
LLLLAEKEAKKFPDTTNEITTVGSPQYRVYLEGRTYPEISEVYISIEKALEEGGKLLDVEYKMVQQKNKN